MNAAVFAPTQLDEAVLWLCVKHPPQRRIGIARILGREPSAITQTMNRLRRNGYIDHGRGSCTPLPKALSYVSMLSEDTMRGLLRLRHIPSAMEPRGSIAGQSDACGQASDREPNRNRTSEQSAGVALPCDSQAIVNALQDLQDPLLRAANSKLQARIAELEAENAELRKRLQTARERVGFALHGL